jgi:gas vesicle protein
MIFSRLYEKRKKEKQRKLKIQTAKKVLVGTVAGSLSGLLGGLLFSPKSGKETREDIANTSKDITNNIKNKTVELKETMDIKVSEVKDSAADAKIKIKQKTAELKETIDNKVSEAKDSVTEAKVKISEYLNDKKASKTDCETVVVTIDSEDLSSILEQADTEKK